MIIRPGGGDAPGAVAFAFIGAPAVIPLGMLTDRVNRTLLLAISLLLWALAMGVTGAAISFAMLFGARLFLGIVAATTGPTAPSLIGDLVPSSKRGASFGYINSGQLIGDGIGFVLPVVVLGFLSWRWCFWILGIAGLALPLFIVGAFFLAGAGPPLDAVRIDVIVPRLRGRAEAIRQVLRTIVEGGAPLLIGVLSGVLAGGGPAGLQLTLIVLLPVLLISGLMLLFALRTYQPDIAAALASQARQGRQESPDQGGRGASA